MTTEQIISIASACIVSAGGIGAIVIAIIRFSSEIISKSLAEKYSLKMNKELEVYRNDIDKKKSISKVMFDKEFEIYTSFNKIFSDLYNQILILDAVSSQPGKILSMDDLMRLNVPDILLGQSKGEVITEFHIIRVKEDISEKIMQFRNLLGYSGPFIPHNNWVLYQELCNACHQYMIGNKKEEIEQIVFHMGKMQVELRRYLEELVVI